MAKFKLRKGIKIGDIAAENDGLLRNSFVDLGSLEDLLDTSKPEFLIVGRTGSGKSALLRMIRDNDGSASTLDPEGLSLQYLHNSTVLKTLVEWGVHLEIFYKYLWRHVCILELVRMRYGDSEDVPSKISQLFPIKKLFRPDEEKTKAESQHYLKQYGKDYWIEADTQIKKITTEVEDALKSDAAIAAKLGSDFAGLSAGKGDETSHRRHESVEREVVERAQKVVSDFQIAALNRVVDLLSQHGFNDPQKKFYVLIDDLDKEWMPDDQLYLALIKSLLQTVNELNGKLDGAKIIVAVRENIYLRVFGKATVHEPQREKWQDVEVRLRWSGSDLKQLVDNRLREIFKAEYTNQVPAFADILPAKKKSGEDPVDFILERTLSRPRDVIDFVNTYLRFADGTKGTWRNLHQAEIEYSARRLTSVFDEWKDTYFGLPALFPLLKKLGPKFKLSDILEEDVMQILADDCCTRCPWLQSLAAKWGESRLDVDGLKTEFVKALFLVGVLGVKVNRNPVVQFSWQSSIDFSKEDTKASPFIVHMMFLSALGLVSGLSAAAGGTED